MPLTDAIEAINKAIREESETISPPFHIFNDQDRVLFSYINSEGVQEDSHPLYGFVMYHRIGTPWPDGLLNFPIPPNVQMQGNNFGVAGFQIPSDVPADFDWNTVVNEALDRLREIIPDPWVKRAVEYIRAQKKAMEEERQFRMVKSDLGIHAEMMVSHYNGTSEVEICLDGKLVATIHHGGIELCTNVDPALGIWTDGSSMMRVHKGIESREMVTPAKVKNEF